uniref:Beta/kappa-theraphotoxin-Cg2a n=1 Tax=Chilobrachys guangxiensis TaxID=278060 RepID=JZTX5_CHIGU|nr:RecName: Full=Beta/kappa-theraphotoxin-Cg2a; Short=Beta/kappa-TRTX-Cg2a; AltName: Full=Beta-theraphotoxin-Cj2a; AltName: Full=Jingzhaotoxin-5; AltName: Full=Jingzhaotoxin-V; Short=JZTX-V; AltName: Full=Peptide F8-15.73; Flags: Precursor [Chilobrachys guangxiensis]CAJ21615.1 jingzhaotoxin-V precursor [Chilobrachys guangxiensis]
MKASVFAVILGLVVLCACSFAEDEQDQFVSPNELLKSMFVESRHEFTPEVEGRYCQKWMWTCDSKRACCEGLRCKLWCRKIIG